jgi:hypothetical protein
MEFLLEGFDRAEKSRAMVRFDLAQRQAPSTIP